MPRTFTPWTTTVFSHRTVGPIRRSVPKISPETNSWYVLLPKAIGLPSYFDMPWRSNATIDVGHSIWICPSNPRRSNGTELFHYCLNELVDGTGADEHRVKLEDLRRPASIVHLFDSKISPPSVRGLSSIPICTIAARNLFSSMATPRRFKNTEYWNFKTNKGITNNPALVWIP